ncbi:MAG: hypothetical protein HY540_07765 [Deltaproteobacteria bacterium]|nr:hypothetical protein [Deltaproteobacteria bacterium]
MSLSPIQPDLVRYEMRMVQGVDPKAQEQKKPGAFGRFLSGMGKVLGAVTFPLSFLFPPAAIGAASMYGVGAIGDQVQGNAYQKQMEKMQRENATTVAFPGLSVGGSEMTPASAIGPGDAQAMDVILSRNEAMTKQAHSI